MITIIPIELLTIEDDGTHILCHAMINRKKARMLIDTGASRTVFDSNQILNYLSSDEKVFQENEKLSTGVGSNTLTSHVFTIKTLKLGELKINNYQAVSIDMQHVNTSYSSIGIKAITGVIGGDILSKFHSVINYKKKQIKFYY